MALLFHGWKSLEGNSLGDIEVEELPERTPTTRQRNALEALATREAPALVDETAPLGTSCPLDYRTISGRTGPSATRDLAQAVRAGYLVAAGETSSRRYRAGLKLQAVQPVLVTPRSAASAPSRRAKLIPQRSRRTR